MHQGSISKKRVRARSERVRLRAMEARWRHGDALALRLYEPPSIFFSLFQFDPVRRLDSRG
jgi:hypothetical protein